MKKYKVGDTIYLKGKVKEIDDTTLPYCVDFVSNKVWVTSDNIIDELPTAEPVKPALPKKVADELEIAKECKDSFDVYIMRIINGHNAYENSHVFWNHSGDGVIKTLMNAYVNGYTVAKDKKYNVKVPHTQDAWYYIAWNSDLRPVSDKELCSKFTEADIEHYGLQDCEKVDVTDDDIK